MRGPLCPLLPGNHLSGGPSLRASQPRPAAAGRTGAQPGGRPARRERGPQAPAWRAGPAALVPLHPAPHPAPASRVNGEAWTTGTSSLQARKALYQESRTENFSQTPNPEDGQTAPKSDFSFQESVGKARAEDHAFALHRSLNLPVMFVTVGVESVPVLGGSLASFRALGIEFRNYSRQQFLCPPPP